MVRKPWTSPGCSCQLIPFWEGKKEGRRQEGRGGEQEGNWQVWMGQEWGAESSLQLIVTLGRSVLEIPGPTLLSCASFIYRPVFFHLGSQMPLWVLSVMALAGERQNQCVCVPRACLSFSLVIMNWCKQSFLPDWILYIGWTPHFLLISRAKRIDSTCLF